MRLLILMMCISAISAAVWSDDAPLQSGVLTLLKAVQDKSDLTLHIGLRGNNIVAAFATGYTGRGHVVDTTGLAFDGTHLTGTVGISITPDDYLLAMGKTLLCSYKLDAVLADGAFLGTYDGTTDGSAVKGKLAGTLAQQPDDTEQSRFRVRVCHLLQRSWRAKGLNYKYALDFNLIFSVIKGNIHRVQLETIVPDYRRYCAVVTRQDLKLDGFTLTGTIDAMIDTGEQGLGRDMGKREEPYTLTINALVIDNTVAGSYDVTIGTPDDKDYLVSKNEQLLGNYSIGAPPKPEEAIAWLRLHKAMGDGYPVLLDLSIVDGKKIHGLSYVSGYNHMPHAIDCSGLKREGNHIFGRLIVDIAPDCYRPIEEFNIDLLLDARIEGQDITGVFASLDRGKAFSGIITGETRTKKVANPPVTAATLTDGELVISTGFPAGKGGTGSPVIRFTSKDGRVQKVEVALAEPKGNFSATIEKTNIIIDADRLTGDITFTAVSDQVAAGKYSYIFSAIINGNDLSGYWRGTCNGKDILVKSAKFGGKLTAK